jgi:4-alpha-glucanotransferase
MLAEARRRMEEFLDRAEDALRHYAEFDADAGARLSRTSGQG